MGTTKTRPWDITESLDDDERIAAALEEGDVALGEIARARGMNEIVQQPGHGRESLHRARPLRGALN